MTKLSLRVTDEYLKDLELMGLIIKEEGGLMAICVECEYKNIDRGTCKNPDLPITDFVYGVRACNILNAEGNCKGFKPLSQDEPIYELKEGRMQLIKVEGLAEIGGEVVKNLAAKGIKP